MQHGRLGNPLIKNEYKNQIVSRNVTRNRTLGVKTKREAFLASALSDRKVKDANCSENDLASFDVTAETDDGMNSRNIDSIYCAYRSTALQKTLASFDMKVARW